MKLKVFTIYDSVVEAFLPPFFMVNEGAAIRAFSDSVSDPQHMFNKHSSNYKLCILGEFDDTTGCFDSYMPKTVIHASTIKADGVNFGGCDEN